MNFLLLFLEAVAGKIVEILMTFVFPNAIADLKLPSFDVNLSGNFSLLTKEILALNLRIVFVQL